MSDSIKPLLCRCNKCEMHRRRERALKKDYSLTLIKPKKDFYYLPDVIGGGN